jgi:hypothetical protein
MQGPAILDRHLKDACPGSAVETYVTGDGVHARRSDDLVPALTPEALWSGKPLLSAAARSSP